MKLSLAARKALLFGKQEAVAMLISLGFASNDQSQFTYSVRQIIPQNSYTSQRI